MKLPRLGQFHDCAWCPLPLHNRHLNLQSHLPANLWTPLQKKSCSKEWWVPLHRWHLRVFAGSLHVGDFALCPIL